MPNTPVEKEDLGRLRNKRIPTSIGLVCISLLGIISYPFCGIIVVILTLIALYEFFYMIEKKGVVLFKGFGLFIGIIIPITTYYGFEISEGWSFLFVVVGLFVLFILELTKKEKHQPIISISTTIFGILYISWCFSFLIRIRQLQDGGFLVAFLLLLTKASDMGAYFWGKEFGKKPLIRRVSPNKTVEGTIGGFFTSFVVGMMFSLSITTIGFFHKLILSIIIPIISQLGDLFESLIKRDCDVKDSGKLLPGIGGVLDVIDSMIFTAPTFYLYLIMIGV